MLLARWKTFGALAVSGALTWGLLAPTAQADVMWVSDAPKDVQVIDDRDPLHMFVMSVVDDSTSDITRLVAHHRRYRVEARLELADLWQPYDWEMYFRFEVRTDAGRYRVLYQFFDLGGGGSYSLRERGPDGRYRNVDCEGFVLEANYDEDFIRWSLARSCVGRPSWVRMGADTFQFGPSPAEYDDALSIGEIVDPWQRRTTVGPRLLPTALDTDPPAHPSRRAGALEHESP